MKVIIDGIEYVPKPKAEPAWGNGAVADVFLDNAMAQLARPVEDWGCDTMDVIDRCAAYKTAYVALKWYRDHAQE